MLVRAEVGVRDHPQWFPTLLLEMGVPQSSLEFADMASFTSHFGWGGVLEEAGTPGGFWRLELWAHICRPAFQPPSCLPSPPITLLAL